MSTTRTGEIEGIPILLLKTRSTPNDGYEEQFSTAKDGVRFRPTFVPVLEHRFPENGLGVVRGLLGSKHIGRHEDAKYGGMIFTSQRAVEAFTRLVEDGKGAYEFPRSSTATSIDDGR